MKILILLTEPCATAICPESASWRVYWPGQTSLMCDSCKGAALRVAAAMGVKVDVERLPPPRVVLPPVGGDERPS